MKAKIKCCIPCKPPKRRPACHDTCKEYIDERREYDRQQAELRELKYKEHDKVRGIYESIERNMGKHR